MFEIQKFESVDSTMNIAREKLRHGVVIQAEEQTGGRGRRGNQWISPKGNLYQSIVLKPKTERMNWGQLSFVIAVALGKVCEELSINQYDLKWPNDVLIDGQKLAGILIEVTDDFVIIGTGVNVEHAPEDRSKIHDFAPHISVDDFRDIFLKHIGEYFNQWEEGGFDPIRQLWMKKAYRLGEGIQARLPNAIYDGVFEDLDKNGILLLRQKDGLLRKINSGEILVCS